MGPKEEKKRERGCTWEGCERDGRFPQLAQDGEVWALLCHGHEKELGEAKASGEAKRICGVWLKAQGGAVRAAERMMRGGRERWDPKLGERARG